MRQECQFIETGSGDEKVVGSIFLEDDKLSTDGSALAANVLLTKVFVDGDPISASDDPKRWFQALPQTYNGSYLRAKIVRTTKKFADILRQEL